jgi:hypothetical protein
MAQVDPQIPLPTGIMNHSVGLPAADIKKIGMEKALPIITFLDDRNGQYYINKIRTQINQHILEIKRWVIGYGHVRSWADVLLNLSDSEYDEPKKAASTANRCEVGSWRPLIT